MSDSDKKRWLDSLPKTRIWPLSESRFILFSGSLKDLADAYNVSYPTLRLRLDRLLIDKIKILDSQKIEDEFERQLQRAVCGRRNCTTPRSFKKLLSAYQDTKERNENEKS